MPYVTGRVVHDADAHIMETPTWLRDHADPGIRDRIEPAAVPRRQRAASRPATSRSSSATSTPPSTGSPPSTGRTSTPRRRKPRSWRGRTSPPPVRSSPEDRGRALDLLGFSSQLRLQHVPQPAAARLGARRRRRARHRRRPGPQPRHGRVLRRRPAAAAHLLRAALRPRAGHRRSPTRPSTWAPPPCWWRRAARRTTPPATVALDGVWARAQEAGIPVVFHVGGTGDLVEPGYLEQRPPRSRPTSTAARRTSGRSTTWASPTRRCRPSRR